MIGELITQFTEKLIGQSSAIRSVVVTHAAKLAFEHYRQGVGPDDLQCLNSVTKSFISALIGIALERGYLHSLKQRLSEFFPEAIASGVDPRVRNLTITDLLTMTAGFKWDEERQLPLLRLSDAVNYAVRRPIARASGERFNYDSYSSHLLSVLIARTAAATTAEFAEVNLFERLGVQDYRWEADSDRNNWGGFGLYLCSRDLAKFGQLYLDKGVWRGRQLLPAGFVTASTRMQTPGGWPARTGYGYHWWTPDTERRFLALGFGGQALVVYPKLKLVVVITSDPDKASDIHWMTRDFVAPYASPTQPPFAEK